MIFCTISTPLITCQVNKITTQRLKTICVLRAKLFPFCMNGTKDIEMVIKPVIVRPINKWGLKNMRRLKRKKAVFIKFFTKLNFLDKKRIKKVIGINNAKKTRGIYDIFIRKISSIPELNKSSDRFGAMITYGNNINE